MASSSLRHHPPTIGSIRIGVRMFWDAQNMHSNIPDKMLVQYVDAALKTYNPNFFLCHIFICASDDRNFSRRVANIKTDTCTVTFKRAPMRTLVCDECQETFRKSTVAEDVLVQDKFTRLKEYADRKIVESMMSTAHDFPRQPILLVTTDKDFKNAVEDLNKDDYTMLSAVEGGFQKVPLVATYAEAYWIWKDMLSGLACHQRRSRR